MQSLKRVYDSPYDTVWNSTVDMLRKDLKCVFKKNDKEAGVLETEWVHRMDTEGKKRWMIRASVRKVQSGTEVVFLKKVELQDDVSKSLDKYNTKKKDTVETAAGSWRKTEVDLTTFDGLYQQLEKRLAAQQ